MTKKDFLNILKIVAPIIIVAAIGSVFVNLGMSWFNSLNKPSQWIPNFVIPIVWSVIYITFAVLLVLQDRKQKIDKKQTSLLILNGFLNILWCLVFFTLKQTFLGNITIILNLIAGILLVLDIKKKNELFGYILLIYPIWLSIATTLNLAIWILN